MFNTKAVPMTNNSSQVQKKQKGVEVNKVYKTDDLSIFTQIDGNRSQNVQHIRRLSESISVYGMKCNPILVNEKFQVIDGQHRLMAAKESKTFIYYIVVNGYSLNEVHTLNLNQKNWTKKDFMDGYANMGLEPYIKLKKFVEKNDDFSFGDCMSMCSNLSVHSNNSLSQKYRADGSGMNMKEVFEEGTWVGKDFELAQEWANKIRMLKPYYTNYYRSSFVGTLIMLFSNPKFDFNEFMHKVRLQPSALVDCANRGQYKTLIEDIYNFRSRNKVSLRY
jgi:hypothetical protein